MKRPFVAAPIALMALTPVMALILVPAPAVSQTGTIVGTVRVEGDAPTRVIFEVTKNVDVCGETIPAADVLISDGMLENSLVFLEGVEGSTEPVEYSLSNFQCRFAPSVLAVASGGTLVVDNQDDVLHNTHLNFERGTRTRTVGNWALSSKGSVIRADRPLRRAGVIDVECDAHSWMHAKIRIFDHPFFSTSTALGGFEIASVPVGTHVLKAWHEVFGELSKEVTVTAGVATSVEFVFSLQSDSH